MHDNIVYPEDVEQVEPKRPAAPKKIEQPKRPNSFEFEFWIEAPSAHRVTVAGEFNGWNKDSIALEKQGNSWRLMHMLPIESSKQHY